MSTKLVAIALLALALAPAIADAHIQGARPILQRGQGDRVVTLGQPEPLSTEAILTIGNDPLRHVVTHFIAPSKGIYSVEYREDGSRPAERFVTEWRFERLVEYRDVNVNGFFEPAVDNAVRAWRYTHYQWTQSEPLRAQVADVQGMDVVWEGNLTGAPKVRSEVVMAGQDFSDEGAIVRPQDIVMYIDHREMPERGLGSLYAIEVTITTHPDATLSTFEAENTTTAVAADRGRARTLLVWGGEAVIDGSEQRIDATLEDVRINDAGDQTARFVLHLPPVDAAMRFVMVSGAEYVIEDRRSPAPLVALFLGAMMVALLRRAR